MRGRATGVGELAGIEGEQVGDIYALVASAEVKAGRIERTERELLDTGRTPNQREVTSRAEVRAVGEETSLITTLLDAEAPLRSRLLKTYWS